MTNDPIEWVIMTCKGICIRHKAPRPHVSNGNRFYWTETMPNMSDLVKVEWIMVSMM
ncbi:MAG TPA: hypothetical protein VEL70_05875 [Candidatus Acidoferrum sp.]|nr:hypothetical protein [Candidatus Acidoferrum sp.]